MLFFVQEALWDKHINGDSNNICVHIAIFQKLKIGQ